VIGTFSFRGPYEWDRTALQPCRRGEAITKKRLPSHVNKFFYLLARFAVTLALISSPSSVGLRSRWFVTTWMQLTI